MVQTLGESTRKHLILIKQVYNHAFEQSFSNHYFSNRFISIISFDWSNESLLKAILSSIDPTIKPKFNFNDLINQCIDIMQEHGLGKLPSTTGIIKVHDIRNAAQHHARQPNVTEVNDCRTHTYDFLTDAMSTVWDINFNELYMSDAICHREVQNYIKLAEIKLSEQDMAAAVLHAACAFSRAISMVEHPMLGGTFRKPCFQSTVTFNTGDPLNKLEEKIRQTFDKTWTETDQAFQRESGLIIITALGIDLNGYLKFRALAPLIQFSIGGVPWADFRKDNYTEEEAKSVYSFCVDSILQIEKVVEDLKTPFGLTEREGLRIV